MGTWTIYTAGADLTLLNAILNGVAMICSQTAFVWGFAAVASLWLVVRTTTAGAILGTTAGQAGPIMSRGAMSALIPQILALLLTAPGMKCTVQVESILTGAVTSIDNVPFVIAVIPAEGSLMASNVNGVIMTAFSNTNPDYSVISATGNGFLDPMKRLLSARTAIQRLNGVDSELRALVSSCLASDAGFDYAQINNLVINAGNTGATAAQTLNITGVPTTAVGALLYQASQNTTGVVTNVSNGNTQQILSCADAALQVQSDIDAALNSPEFARVIQGAVNGMDQPQPGADYSINQLSAEYLSLRKWSNVTGNLAGGQQQANAEAINFLFAELVSNALNCLRADGSDKTICEAAMIQATEVERNNIQAAANEVPMLQYAGSFGNYILALIIGLGPVIVMFMMFAGVAADKCLKSVVHIMVWPLLVTNVGAELVNAMISLQFSNFMASVSRQGFLSLATMHSLYRELSLQVGTGSHIMASLPVLMSMIFALGEGAALVSVANELNPKGTEVGRTEAPSPTEAAPLSRQGSPVMIAQGEGFSRVQALGAIDAVSASQQFANVSRDTSRVVSDAETRQHTLSEGRNNLHDWQRSFQSGDYSKWALSHTEGESIRQQYEANQRSGHADKSGQAVVSQLQNQNSSDVGAKVSVGPGRGLLGLGLGGGVDTSTRTAATDYKSKIVSGDRSDSAESAASLSRALNSDVTQQMVRDHGGDTSNTFRDSQSLARTYQDLTTKSQSNTDSVQEALKVGSTLVGAHAKMGSDEIAQQMHVNGDYQRFQLSEGRKRDLDPAARKHYEQAARDMATGSSDEVLGDPRARAAVLRTRAAVLQYGDESATPQERFAALKFLSDGARAMTHIGFAPARHAELERKPFNIADPVDRTGVTGQIMVRSSAGKNGAAHPGHLEGAEALRSEIEGQVRQGDDVKAKAQDMLHDADESGLGENGAGTARRAAANVADNAADVVRAPGTRSRVRYGKEPPAPPAKPSDDTPNEPPLGYPM